MLIAAGGMASTLGIFSAVLLSVSRVPRVMADDRLLPKKLHEEHPRYGTPYISIILCALVVSAMILWTFSDLIIIDVTFYGAGLLLEFISLVVLRVKVSNEPRPFRIPLSIGGLCLLFLLPICDLAVALTAVIFSAGEAVRPAVFTLAALLTAELVWQGIRIFGNPGQSN